MAPDEQIGNPTDIEPGAGAPPPRGTEQADIEEAGLLARIAAGDHGEPLAELYDRYAPRIYRLGLRLLGDRDSAEDLVQDAFVRLWRSAPRFDPSRGTARVFLLTIARRAAIDLLRRASARPPAATAAEPDAGPASAAEPDRAVEVALLALAVADALETLPADHREVINLAYHDDLTQQQIAKRLGVPLGTVKSRTYHAMRALRAKLEERDFVA